MLGLLLALVIVAFLYFVVLKAYFRQPAVDEQTKELFTEQNININPSNYRSTLDGAKKTIRDYNKSVLEREKEIEKW